MKALDVMVSPVITISPDTSIEEAADTLLKNRISGMPVLDGTGALVGIISEGDFLRRVEAGTERHRPRWLELLTRGDTIAAEYVKSHGRKVSDVMTTWPVSVGEDTPLMDIADLMESRQIMEAAQRAKENGSTRFCMGAAWKGVRDGDGRFEQVLESIREVSQLGMEVCVTLGQLGATEARKLKEAAKGRAATAPLLLQSDGSPWADSPGQNCHRDVDQVVATIGLDPAQVTMYALRHSSIVRMLVKNIPIRLVASLHNTSVAMIEKHYSKHIDQYGDEHARAALLQHEQPSGANIIGLGRRP